MNDRQRLEAIVSVVCKYLPPDGISKDQAITEIISLVDPLPKQDQSLEIVEWRDVDGTGIPEPVYRLKAQQEQGESVASIHIGWDYLDSGQLVATYAVPVKDKVAPQLYTTPQQRTWVELTDEQINQAYADSYKGIPLHEGIVAKFKENNT